MVFIHNKDQGLYTWVWIQLILNVFGYPIPQQGKVNHVHLTPDTDIEGDKSLLTDETRIYMNGLPESQIRFGYGLKYEFRGAALHGLDRYNVMIGLEIPDIRISSFFEPEVIDSKYCDKISNSNEKYKTLQQACKIVWPAYSETTREIYRHQQEIREILYEDLPAVLPNFKVSDLGSNIWDEIPRTLHDSQPEDFLYRYQRTIQEGFNQAKHVVKGTAKRIYKRAKRFVSDLISLGIQGISSLLNHRK